MMEFSKIKLALVDDHPLILDGLKSLLKGHAKYQVVATFSDAESALNALPALDVQILISDISLPGLKGPEMVSRLKPALSNLKILALSMHGDEAHIRQMLDAGADGYILKNSGKPELIQALDALASGKMYFGQEVATELLRPRRMPAVAAEKAEILLSPREKEVLKLVAQEMSNQQIADSLFISERTVETHRKNIYAKTGTKSLAGLVKFAIQNGLAE